MTNRRNGRLSPGAGAAALAAVLLAAACTTSSVEQVAQAPGRSGQPVDTGTFPNLNIPPQAATAQFTEEERQAKLAQLRGLQQRQNSGVTAESAEARRKRLQLAVDEQEDTLKVIEGE